MLCWTIWTIRALHWKEMISFTLNHEWLEVLLLISFYFLFIFCFFFFWLPRSLVKEGRKTQKNLQPKTMSGVQRRTHNAEKSTVGGADKKSTEKKSLQYTIGWQVEISVSLTLLVVGYYMVIEPTQLTKPSNCTNTFVHLKVDLRDFMNVLFCNWDLVNLSLFFFVEKISHLSSQSWNPSSSSSSLAQLRTHTQGFKRKQTRNLLLASQSSANSQVLISFSFTWNSQRTSLHFAWLWRLQWKQRKHCWAFGTKWLFSIWLGPKR